MIGIICAINNEIDTILDKVELIDKIEYVGSIFYKSKYDGKELLIAKSGVGKINATKTTMIMIEKFNVDKIINIGTAGSISELKLLDTLLVNKVYEYDFDTSMIDEDFEFNSIIINNKLFNELKLLKNIYVGELISGDTFIADNNRISELKNTFKNAKACDMESFAIVKIASEYNIDVAIIRSISDETLLDNSEQLFRDYATLSSEKSTNILLSYIKSI